MLKTIFTLVRGATFRAEEEFADRSALLILDQQIRDAAGGIERAKRALAVAIAQDEAEGKRLETTLAPHRRPGGTRRRGAQRRQRGACRRGRRGDRRDGGRPRLHPRGARDLRARDRLA